MKNRIIHLNNSGYNMVTEEQLHELMSKKLLNVVKTPMQGGLIHYKYYYKTELG